MNAKMCLAVAVLSLACCPLHAQKPKQQEVQLFTIAIAELQQEQHAWGNELFLHITGQADRALDGCVLGIAIWHCGERVRWKLLPLRYDEKKLLPTVTFDDTWGPLNRTAEYVLSGQYTVEISLPLDHQPASARSGLDKFLAGRKIKSDKRALQWGSQQSFAQEDQHIKKFYGDRIARLQQLYQEMHKRLATALPAPTSPNKKNKANPATVGQLQAAVEEWRNWLRGTFEKELANETQLFGKFHRKIFSRRYPLAKGSLEEYYNSLLRLARLHNVKVYQSHRLSIDRKENKLDTTGLERVENIQDNLQRLLRQTAQELQLNLPGLQSGKNK